MRQLLNRYIFPIVTLSASIALTPLAVSPVAHAEPVRLCAWNFQPAEPFLQHGAVIAGGYAVCGTAPENLTVRLRLWHKPHGGNWVLRADDSSALPRPYRLNFAVRYLGCIPGAWRTEYNMDEYTADGYTRSENGKSVYALITC